MSFRDKNPILKSQLDDLMNDLPFSPELRFHFHADMNNYVCESFPENTPPVQSR